MNNLKKIRSGFMLAALMLTLAVMTFPIEAWAEKIPYKGVYIHNGKKIAQSRRVLRVF